MTSTPGSASRTGMARRRIGRFTRTERAAHWLLASTFFVMLFTGIRHLRRLHIATGILFSVLWIGTFITGVFFLRHELP